MSSDQGHQIEQAIEAYLDGRGSAAERAAFEERLAQDASLRAEVRVQRAIDTSLRGAFPAPVMADILARAQAQARPQPVKPSFKARPLKVRLLVEAGLAAAIGIALGVGYLVWNDQQKPGVRQVARISMSDFYRQREKNDFPPDWVCEPERFKATFAYKFNQPLLMAEAPGVVMKGLAYSNTLSPDTVEIISKVNNRGVIVFIDRATAGEEQKVCESSGMHLFKRELAGLNLYELTPWDKPSVLDLIYVPK